MNNPFPRTLCDVTIWTLSLGALFFIIAHEAWADSKPFMASNPAWQTECGSCHVAFPPQMLPASAWRDIMSGLSRHFGSDASVDPRVAQEIGTFLEQHAGSSRRVRAAGTLRITETPWFRHEHDEIAASVWKRPAVGTPANCTACHTTAARGDFRNRNIAVPR